MERGILIVPTLCVGTFSGRSASTNDRGSGPKTFPFSYDPALTFKCFYFPGTSPLPKVSAGSKDVPTQSVGTIKEKTDTGYADLQKRRTDDSTDIVRNFISVLESIKNKKRDKIAVLRKISLKLLFLPLKNMKEYRNLPTSWSICSFLS
ncbi:MULTISPECIES: hypothetical protein [Desulfonatronospira]|uniref:hypothetical protein n=1 Tax=Desulfonatronospira TaxID=488937 RepID=UPI0002F7FADF|nr:MULTISPECIES: hypothetical protein [Desulfonatronospira]RQD76280.1 MAG: hypothetical protein D5S03_06710 [Desulfonatronospira sp. MSAO_Bac3]